MRNRLREFLQSRRATAAIEFAIIAPVMVIMAAGISEFGRYFVVYDATNRLATQYASAWADCSDVPTGTCATELSTFASANVIANVAPQLTASNTSLSMFQVTMTGGTPVVVSSYPSGGSLSAAQTAAATSTFANGQSGVVVTVSYTHTLNYFPAVMTPYLNSVLSFSFTVAQLKS